MMQQKDKMPKSKLAHTTKWPWHKNISPCVDCSTQTVNPPHFSSRRRYRNPDYYRLCGRARCSPCQPPCVKPWSCPYCIGTSSRYDASSQCDNISASNRFVNISLLQHGKEPHWVEVPSLPPTNNHDDAWSHWGWNYYCHLSPSIPFCAYLLATTMYSLLSTDAPLLLSWRMPQKGGRNECLCVMIDERLKMNSIITEPFGKVIRLTVRIVHICSASTSVVKRQLSVAADFRKLKTMLLLPCWATKFDCDS